MGLGLSADDAEKRRVIVGEINGVLAEVDAAVRRAAEADAQLKKVTNDARAAVGTANAELAKTRKRYEHLRAQLERLLPSVEREPWNGETSGEAV